MFGLFGRKKEEKKEETEPSRPTIPEAFRIEKSFTVEDVNKAKSELRISSVERDVWSETLARIYEAAAEGKITVEERDRLVAKYREQLSKLDSVLDHNQKIISLHELEETRAELMKMFNEKFKEVSVKIDEFRNKLGYVPKITTEVRFTPSVEKEIKHPLVEKPLAPIALAAPKKTKADEELEKLQEELRKELEKLEQIEMET